MADRDDAAERTESPTPKRRREARNRGQVARSQEVNSLIILTAGSLLILGFHKHVFNSITGIFNGVYSISPELVEAGNITDLGVKMFFWFFPIVMPFFLGIIGAGLLANVGQVGFHISTEAFSPKLDRINPVSGFKRIFSWRSVMEAAKGLVKICIIGFVAYKALKPAVNGILALSVSSRPDIIGMSLQVGFSIAIRALIIMVIVACLDYAFQFWQHEKSIKMTLKELRDELKETEGDPLVRERIKSIQREMARRRMMNDVKKADVVITNPTSLAVALAYSMEHQAPKVVAKGRRHLAEKIKERAREFKIPIVENKPLARTLYKVCKVGESVPVNLYRAVAEILAYVYSLKSRKRPRPADRAVLGG